MAPARRTVLVIEDSPDFVDLVMAALSTTDYFVVITTNGEEALAYLGANDLPAVIVLDLSMPVMDGSSFRAAQERSERLRHVPVIVYSAERDLPRLARGLGVAAYVSKAESPFRVAEEVRRCCR